MKSQFRGKKKKNKKQKKKQKNQKKKKKAKQNCYAPKTMTEIGYNEHNVVIEGKRK